MLKNYLVPACILGAVFSSGLAGAQSYPDVFSAADRANIDRCVNRAISGGFPLPDLRILDNDYTCYPMTMTRESQGGFRYRGQITRSLTARPDDRAIYSFRVEPNLVFFQYAMTDFVGAGGDRRFSNSSSEIFFEYGGVFDIPFSLINALQDWVNFSPLWSGPEFPNAIYGAGWEGWNDWETVTGYLFGRVIAAKMEQIDGMIVEDSGGGARDHRDTCFDHRIGQPVVCPPRDQTTCFTADGRPTSNCDGDDPGNEVVIIPPANGGTSTRITDPASNPNFYFDQGCGCWQRRPASTDTMIVTPRPGSLDN